MGINDCLSHFNTLTRLAFSFDCIFLIKRWNDQRILHNRSFSIFFPKTIEVSLPHLGVFFWLPSLIFRAASWKINLDSLLIKDQIDIRRKGALICFGRWSITVNAAAFNDTIPFPSYAFPMKTETTILTQQKDLWLRSSLHPW